MGRSKWRSTWLSGARSGLRAKGRTSPNLTTPEGAGVSTGDDEPRRHEVGFNPGAPKRPKCKFRGATPRASVWGSCDRAAELWVACREQAGEDAALVLDLPS
ncbi:MAG: hypothetical protein IPK82_33845 [Polyangiaceae bacterium]|nr:hypothetical protein [Polyangiaceae bacterium]